MIIPMMAMTQEKQEDLTTTMVRWVKIQTFTTLLRGLRDQQFSQSWDGRIYLFVPDSFFRNGFGQLDTSSGPSCTSLVSFNRTRLYPPMTCSSRQWPSSDRRWRSTTLRSRRLRGRVSPSWPTRTESTARIAALPRHGPWAAYWRCCTNRTSCWNS